MSPSPVGRPQAMRKSSRLPGGFDEAYDDLEHLSDFDQSIQGDIGNDSIELPSLPEDNSNMGGSHDQSYQSEHGRSALDEGEMNHKLLDVESSFLPELSHLAHNTNSGADDTYMFGVPKADFAQKKPADEPNNTGHVTSNGSGRGSRSPKTPPENYKTPGPEKQEEEERMRRQREEDAALETMSAANTSSLETLSSSPTAAAAARTVSRVISMASLGGYETAVERGSPESPTRHRPADTTEDLDATPRKGEDRSSKLELGSETTANDEGGDQNSRLFEPTEPSSEKRTKRPKYLQSRHSSQRLSQSSFVSSVTDPESDTTMGADFALQSGGAAPEQRKSRKSNNLSRATSLGSMASGLSALSEDESLPTRRNIGNAELGTLDEEDRFASDNQPLTPRASKHNMTLPTDTVIANNVRDIEVPGTFARQYRQTHRSISPAKTPFMTTPASIRTGKNMTLKEHRSTVDRLGKENFDLKMKIHFLDQALQRRSEDGVKETITENVQLKSDMLRLEKENHSLRKSVRDLEKKMKDRDSGATAAAAEKDLEDEQRMADAEEEILWLREQVETYEVEIKKMRTDMMSREAEKRRLAEAVKSLGETRPPASSEVGSREERDMWKDMLEAETAAREQADDENKRLKEEIELLRSEIVTINRRPVSRRGNRFSSGASQASSLEKDRDVIGSQSSTTLVELERLRHENSELQRVIGAQTSTLTSRNREKERLYQEIEDLKLGQRRGDGRSVAGDSILERSASRTRSQSQVSIGTRMSRTSEGEKEVLEIKNGELRDQVSALKLENQGLKNQLDEVNADVDALEAQAQADIDALHEELNIITMERDDAVREANDLDDAFQQLKNEAQEEIDSLGDEIEQKADDCRRLEAELRDQQENFMALQAELHSAGEGIVRLEEDSQANLQRYKDVQQELAYSNKELEALEKNLEEATSKIQRLTVQQESSHNEIAFLREEQDADKIKIGDLEAALETTSVNLQSEKDKTEELDKCLAEERYQREVIASKEKQEVQKMMNELNREVSAARDEVRRLKKALSAREIELTSWRDRLTELENSLRDLLGEPDGTRATFLNTISRLQKDLDSTSMELDSTRQRLDEKETLLADRVRLLESSGLESRKLSEMLEKERQARRADKHSFEQTLRSHQQATRSISHSNTRISELEAARQSDRRKFIQAENQYKEQLGERNGILLQLWKKLSTMCGPDWAHSNSLINGNLPSQEVIGNILFWPGFSRNLLLAAKQVEGTIGIFKERIKRIERELWKEYKAIEHTIDVRMKKLERVEEIVSNMRSQQRQDAPGHTRSRSGSDFNKLKGENRLLKAELSLLQQQQRAEANRGGGGIPPRGSSHRASGSGPSTSLMRAHSSNVVEHLQSAEGTDRQNGRSNSVSSRASVQPTQGFLIPAYNGGNGETGQYNLAGQDKWIHRLRELERRLKAEREARLQDRSGARKRLEERDAVNEELRMELERERMRRETGFISSAKPSNNADDQASGGR